MNSRFRKLYICDVFNAFNSMFFLDLWKSWFALSVDPSTNLFFNRAEQQLEICVLHKMKFSNTALLLIGDYEIWHKSLVKRTH